VRRGVAAARLRRSSSALEKPERRRSRQH
jgi:hypothetical protein